MGDKVSRTSWVGVAAATLGAALIAGKPGAAGTPLGVALSMGSLLIFLAWLVVLKRAPRVKSAIAIPAVTVVVAAAVILPIAVGMHGPPKLNLPPVTWLAVAGLGVLATLVATTAWQYGASKVPSASAGVFINIEPLFGAAVGVLAFNDNLTFALALGGAMIVAGSLIVVRGERVTPPGEGAPPTPA
jgi:drug/metabolite transporter (DMT)-like permease